MNTDKITRTLKRNGITLTREDNTYTLEPIKTSTLKYVLIAMLIIPSIAILVFVTGPSLVGRLILGAGFVCLFIGLMSRHQAAAFNSSRLSINENKIEYLKGDIPTGQRIKFKSNRSTNSVFPNVDIILQEGNNKGSVLKIWNKDSKYINRDRFDIVDFLNEINTKGQNII